MYDHKLPGNSPNTVLFKANCQLNTLSETYDSVYRPRTCTVYLIGPSEDLRSIITICTPSESLPPKLSNGPLESHLGVVVQFQQGFRSPDPFAVNQATDDWPDAHYCLFDTLSSLNLDKIVPIDGYIQLQTRTLCWDLSSQKSIWIAM